MEGLCVVFDKDEWISGSNPHEGPSYLKVKPDGNAVVIKFPYHGCLYSSVEISNGSIINWKRENFVSHKNGMTRFSVRVPEGVHNWMRGCYFSQAEVKTGRYKVFVCLDGDSNKRYHIFSEGSKLSLTQLKEDKELKDFLSQLPSPHNLWMKEIGESGNGYLGAAKAEKNEDASLPMNISSIVESAIATTSAAKSADESADESSPKPVELNPNESAAESAAESSTESVKKQKKKPKKKPKKNKVNIPREHFKRVVKAIIKLILNSKKKSTGHPQIVGLVKQLCGFSKNKGYGDFSELKDEFRVKDLPLFAPKQIWSMKINTVSTYT